MTKRTSFFFLLTTFLLSHCLLAIDSDDEGEQSPTKKPRLYSPEAACAMPLANTDPSDTPPSYVPPCAPISCAPKKPKARKVLTAACMESLQPWSKPNFRWSKARLPWSNRPLWKNTLELSREGSQNPPFDGQSWDVLLSNPEQYEAYLNHIAHQKVDCIRNKHFHDWGQHWPWDIDPDFLNKKAFAHVKSFIIMKRLNAIPRFAFADTLVQLKLSLENADLEPLSHCHHLRDLTLDFYGKASYEDELKALKNLTGLQTFYLDVLEFHLTDKQEVEAFCHDLKTIIENNINLNELFFGRGEYLGLQDAMHIAGLEDALKSGTFSLLFIENFHLTSLQFINPINLEELHIVGDMKIEEGFSTYPTKLTRVQLPEVSDHILTSLPLEKLVDIHLKTPCNLKLLQEAVSLQSLCIDTESFLSNSTQSALCLQELAHLPTDSLAYLHFFMTEHDIAPLRTAVQANPGLRRFLLQKLVYSPENTLIRQALA